MMLVLLGSVRLWTGRGSDAITSLEEARALFTAIDDEFGGVQATATLGRALVAQGRIDEGLDLLAGPAASSAESAAHPDERASAFTAPVRLAALGQLGAVQRPARLPGELGTAQQEKPSRDLHVAIGGGSWRERVGKSGMIPV